MKVTNAKRIDKYIPWMFVLFFVVVACVDAFFMTTAIKTQTGLVTDKAYETGLKYNDILKASNDQKQLGWSHQLNVGKDGAIEFSMKDKQGNLITGADISLLCFRPIQDGMDISAKLIETTPGVYTAKPVYPVSGLWQIFLTAHANKSIYKTNQEIIIQQ